MAQCKIQLLQGGTKYINDTEFVGIHKNGILKAKCAPEGADDSITIKGIAVLWARLSDQVGTGLIETTGVDLGGDQNRQYFNLLLHTWIRRCNNDIAIHLRPLFDRKTEKSQTFKGRVDLFKTELQNSGLLGSVVTDVVKLGYDLPAVRVIKDAYLYLQSSETLLPADRALREAMLQDLSRGLDMLVSVAPSTNPRQSAIAVVQSISSQFSKTTVFALPAKLMGLSKACQFCAEVLLSESLGVTTMAAKWGGIIFNMNYLLQKVVSVACQAIGGRKQGSEFVAGINTVENANRMLPDVLGTFADGTHYIIDAKHKVFFEDGLRGIIRESGKESEDPFSENIDRNDFYQILSYASTHHDTKGITHYALVGLWKSRANSPNYVFTDTKPIVVKRRTPSPDRQQVIISKVAVNFYKVLTDIGSGANYEHVMRELGGEILAKLQEDRPSVPSTPLSVGEK